MSEVMSKYFPDYEKIKPMLEDAEKLGAAAERARIREAVINMTKFVPNNFGRMVSYDDLLKILKEGDGE